jgi:hypothetical protein
MEGMMEELKTLREDKDKQRVLLEQRNKKTLVKLHEVRQARATLLEQSMAKQTELYDTINGLEKGVRDLQGKLELMKRVREELIKLCADEGCEKDALRLWLSAEEKIRLKL